MNMTLISKRKTLKNTFLLCLILFFGFFTSVVAQESLTLSISPSLFDMSVNPSQEWRSTLRVINVNDYDLTVYIDVVNFLPQGESGDGRFVPISEDGAGSTLAEWFKITKEAVVIPREQSVEVPFSVFVPEDASPGGHFAAILVGTRPPDPEAGQAKVQTAQVVTSLFFARVSGDIIENGSIREFVARDYYLERPEVTLDLRFENKGNVHLQPQGDIKIYNLWGQERGVIPINQASQFGNVLPESIRNFTFSWKGEWSIADIGRYTAVASLAYGTEARQFTTAETNFWVIPFKLLFSVLLFVAIFISVLIWLVRIYVRYTLRLAGIDVNKFDQQRNIEQLNLRKKEIKHKTIFIASIKSALADIQNQLRLSYTKTEKIKVLYNSLIKYKLILAALIFVLVSFVIIVWYIGSANTSHRGFEVVYVNSDANVTLTSEEIIFNQLKKERPVKEIEVNQSLPKLAIVNRSGIPGMGAEIRLRLESIGYEVISLSADFTSSQKRSVIVYQSGTEKQALKLSSRLNNAPISVYQESDQENFMTIFVGDDLEPE